jgi:DNA-binding NarL/FixJ family response regulator
MKLLIVEDSPVVRSRLVAALRLLPAVDVVGEVDAAAAAREALPRLRPDAVVLDLQLSDGNGLDVLREMRAGAPARLVIVFTNHAEEHYRRRALAAGADYFLDKSKDLPLLLELLREGTRPS